MTDEEYVESALKKIGKYKIGTLFCFEDIFSQDEWKEIKKHGQASLRFARKLEEKGIVKRTDKFIISSHKNSVRVYEKIK